MTMARKGSKMRNRGSRIVLNGLLSKPLVDVAWVEKSLLRVVI